MGTCPDDDTIQAFVAGELDAPAVAILNQHVAGCSACRELIADTARSPAGLAHLADGASFGRYRIQRPLGSGAMGVVYLAHDAQLDRNVALKLVRTERASGEGMQLQRTRLLREAQAMARISHPNVVAVHDAGEIDGQVFVAMEWVEGQTLSQWLQATRPLEQRLEAFLSAGRGLVAAHAVGLVHRDFKPANVLVGADGRPRVTDFGLARRASEQPGPAAPVPLGEPLPPTSLTQTGAIIGTPAYMAPELLDGVPADPRTDQFSFAVALYEGLYGVRPFHGRTLTQLLESIRAGKVRSPPAPDPVPAEVRRVILRALRVRPADRFADVQAMLDALAATGRKRPRRRGLAWGAGATAACLIAYLAFPWQERIEPVVAGPQPAPVTEPAAEAAPTPLGTELGVEAARLPTAPAPAVPTTAPDPEPAAEAALPPPAPAPVRAAPAPVRTIVASPTPRLRPPAQVRKKRAKKSEPRPAEDDSALKPFGGGR